jgi:hypothetical protein
MGTNVSKYKEMIRHADCIYQMHTRSFNWVTKIILILSSTQLFYGFEKYDSFDINITLYLYSS